MMKQKAALFLILLLALLLSCPGCAEEPSFQNYYYGQQLDGLPHGLGVQYNPEGTWYTGFFKEGLPHGHGLKASPGGTYYLGQWFDNECFGHGALVLGDGAAYLGQWAANMRHGCGIYTWPDGRSYLGQWAADQMHGWGRMRYSDGSIYRGFWEQGLRHGPGEMVHSDGSRERGIWEDDYLKAIPVEGITLSHQSAVLTISGAPLVLEAIITPADATNRTIAWSSSNPAVARVENGVVSPVSIGRAVITATTADGGFEASCSVTVKPDHIPVTGVRISHKSLTLEVGGNPVTLIATLVPAHATNKVVMWSSSNPAVASVGTYGTVTPHKPGTAVITVTTLEGRFTATCTVTVIAPPENEDQGPDDDKEEHGNGGQGPGNGEGSVNGTGREEGPP